MTNPLQPLFRLSPLAIDPANDQTDGKSDKQEEEQLLDQVKHGAFLPTERR